MSKKSIVIAIKPFSPGLQELEKIPGVSVHPTTSHDWIGQKAHVFFGDDLPLDLKDDENLEFVQLGSVGYSQLYGLGLAERGVRVANARGVFDSAIAEWNIAMMINLLRDLPGMFRHQQQGIWDRDARFQRELRGRTVGIWGYGGIGRATARLAKAFGLKIHVMVRENIAARDHMFSVSGTGDPEGIFVDRIYTPKTEKEFLANLDFLIIAMPLTPETTGIIGEIQLRSLPDRAYVLNPARGPIIQENALLQALIGGWISGAALDTHYYYPMPPEHPLWKFPNVIMTPHISGSDSGSYYQERVWELFVRNIKNLIGGEPLLNEIDPELLIK